MMWMKTYIKIISLFLVIVLIVGFFVPSFVLKDIVFAKEDPKSSTIGGMEINDVKTADLATTLQNAISEWQGSEVEIVSDGISKTIDPKQFNFDIATAISQFEMLTKKPWYAFWRKEKIVHIPIPITVNEAITQQIDEAGVWDTDKTLQKLILQAAYLKEHKVEAVINEDFMQAEERIAFQIAELPLIVKE